jgi:hypothetical protein
MNLRKSEIIREPDFPEKKILRKMAYLSDQKGIISRYLREQEGWDYHRQKTRSFVLEKIQESTPSSITVMGSGWLLDFPLEEAYRICRNIRLLDVHHPPQILRKLQDFPGVTPILSDLTGGMIKNVYDFTRKIKKGKIKNYDLSEIPRSRPEVYDHSFTVSLNVLNQLDILLVDYLKKFIEPEEKEWLDFRKFVQSTHIKILARKGCLVSDVQEINQDMKGGAEPGKNLVHVPLPGKIEQEWFWDFDTAGMYYHNMKTRFRVVAVSF